MNEELLSLEKTALDEINACNDLKVLNDLRVNYLGKKSPIQKSMSIMGKLSPEERVEFGKVINTIKSNISTFFVSNAVEIFDLIV